MSLVKNESEDDLYSTLKERSPLKLHKRTNSFTFTLIPSFAKKLKSCSVSFQSTVWVLLLYAYTGKRGYGHVSTFKFFFFNLPTFRK